MHYEHIVEHDSKLYALIAGVISFALLTGRELKPLGKFHIPKLTEV